MKRDTVIICLVAVRALVIDALPLIGGGCILAALVIQEIGIRRRRQG